MPRAREHAWTTSALVSCVALTAWTHAGPVHADVLPRLVIDGEVVVSPGQPVEQRGNVWLVPARPIAEALGAVLVFDGNSMSVSVSIPSQGVTAFYDGVTGQITRDFAPNDHLAPGLPIGTREEDLRLPTDLVSRLFGVTVRVDTLSREVIVISNPLDPERLRADMPAIGVQELRYHGNAVESAHAISGALTLENRTRIQTGLLSTRVDGRYTESRLAHVNSFMTELDTGDGYQFMLGDLRGDSRMGWFRSHGRGIGAEIGIAGGTQRLGASYVQLSAGASESGRNWLGPRFDEHVGMLTYGWQFRDEPLAEDALDVGALWIGRGEERREGLVLGFRHEKRRERFLTRFEGGAFLSPHDDVSHRGAIELNAQWSPISDTQLLVRTGHFGTEFQRASSFAEDGSSFYTLGASRRLSSQVSVSASHSLHHDAALRSTDRTLSSTLGWTPPRTSLQSAVTTLSVAELGRRETRSDLSLDLRGRLSVGRWNLAIRRRLGTGYPLFTSVGILVVSRFGQTQLASSWSENRFAGASVDWTPPLRRLGGASMTLGARWSPTETDDQRGLMVQVTVGYDAGDHSATVDFDQHQVGHLARADWRGRFVLDEGRLVRLADGQSLGYNQPGAIEGRIYIDANLNGTFDDGERPLEGVGVTLDGGMDRRVTNGEGMYAFEALRPGDHHVALDPRTLRADLSLLGGMVGDVTITPLTRVYVEFRACVNRRVSGVVFVDSNGDRRRDPGEPLVADALVFIAGGSNTLSNADGTFRIGDVPPGQHDLQIAPASLSEALAPPAPRRIEIQLDRDLTDLEIGVTPRPRPIVRTQF